MAAVWSMLLGYAMGSFNPSYCAGRLRGFDIRTCGSGNAGASNALITMGNRAGLVCALLDIAKAYFAVRFAAMLFPLFRLARETAGAACILGHMFPAFMGFRGGKGLACLGGTILAFDWRVFFMLLMAEVVVALVSGYICIVSMSAALAVPVIYALGVRDAIGTVILMTVALVMVARHFENVERIRQGKEAQIRFLWKRDKEIERIREFWE